MASEQWDMIDHYENRESNKLCAFIDILGYKEKSERFFIGSFNLKERFGRALKSAISTFKLISHLIDTEQLEIKFFSDSIIITLPEQESGSDQKFGFVLFCAILSANLSFEDLLVRGGIAKGAHIEVNDDAGFSFMASIALQKAYLIESKIAVYPRIVIDPDLVRCLVSVSDEAADYIVAEGNNYFVHFARQVIGRNGDNQSDVFDEMTDLHAAMNAATEAAVKDKYAWILDYYYWTLSLTPNIELEKFSKFRSNAERDFKPAFKH